MTVYFCDRVKERVTDAVFHRIFVEDVSRGMIVFAQEKLDTIQHVHDFNMLIGAAQGFMVHPPK